MKKNAKREAINTETPHRSSAERDPLQPRTDAAGIPFKWEVKPAPLAEIEFVETRDAGGLFAGFVAYLDHPKWPSDSIRCHETGNARFLRAAWKACQGVDTGTLETLCVKELLKSKRAAALTAACKRIREQDEVIRALAALTSRDAERYRNALFAILRGGDAQQIALEAVSDRAIAPLAETLGAERPEEVA